MCRSSSELKCLVASPRELKLSQSVVIDGTVYNLVPTGLHMCPLKFTNPNGELIYQTEVTMVDTGSYFYGVFNAPSESFCGQELSFPQKVKIVVHSYQFAERK